MLRTGWGTDGVMMAELVPLIVGFSLVLWSIINVKGGLEAHLELKFEELSQDLAEVVLKLAQSGQMATVEPPNPMQQLLMGLIQQKMNENPPIRGDNGQFK